MASSTPLSVLHIVGWFPSNEQPKRAIWIKRHIEALSNQGITNQIYHVESGPGKTQFSFGKDKDLVKRFLFILQGLPWRLYELISFLLVMVVLFKERKNQHNAVNFHIAYPNLVYKKWLKLFCKSPIVITEHWSAYHFNFGVTKEKALRRVIDIFDESTPLITVSHALLNDIRNFAKNPKLIGHIVSNVVDEKVFNYTPDIHIPHRFFMLSNWKEPKDPFPVFEAFKAYLEIHQDAQLHVGGYGSLIESMNHWVMKNELSNHILFLGLLEDHSIVEEMNKASAFIHISQYETFSVVCAEAISCGCPVIASNTGGIPEFINRKNGILISEEIDIFYAMQNIQALADRRNQISLAAHSSFSTRKIGTQYLNAFQAILNH